MMPSFLAVRSRPIALTGRRARLNPIARAARLLLPLLLPASLPAQVPDDAPSLEVRRVTQAPVIDGRLDDGVWQGAAVISGFRQKEPSEGEEATEATRVRIVYDEARLYIGIELLDSDAAGIRATELRRDATLDSDDSFTVLLDTFHDHRNAFVFRINPHGTRFDATVRNESSRMNSDWDEDWTAAASVNEQGWTAEISIPFKILRFSDAGEQLWGVNFERVIKRKNELVYWSGWDRNFGFHHVSQAGHLTGLHDLTQAERIRLRPYVLTGRETLGAVESPTGSRTIADVGIDDLKLAITSNLTADLALNPDFAQTEVDAQRVNLTRFSLFFPEKRQFFIEGAGAMRTGIGMLHFGPPPLELFYSRRIGLSNRGEPISLVGGGKLTGKVRGFDVGLLDVRTAEFGAQPGENFAVGRIRKDVLNRSYVGAIFTNRQGSGSYNRVAAVDARFVLMDHLTVAGLAARSFDPAVEEQQWVRHVAAQWRDDLLEAGVIYLDIEPNFNPGIGFVRRRERMVGTQLSLKPRPGGDIIRQLELTPSAVYFHDAERVLQTRNLRFQSTARFQSGDRLQLRFTNRFERLDQSFTIGPDVTLPAGQYEWNEVSVNFDSFNGRKVSASLGVDIGNFYTGTKRSVNLGAEIRPTKNISFSPSYRFNGVDLPEGSFDTHLLGLRSDISYTTNLLSSVLFQYSSTGELVAIQIRFNYIFRNIDNVHVVFNETRYTGGVFAEQFNRSLELKVTYSLRR